MKSNESNASYCPDVPQKSWSDSNIVRSGGKWWSLPPDLPPVVSINISDVTWVLRCLKSLATQLFIQQLVQGNIKEKFYITGNVQEESTMTGGFLSQRASNT